MSDTEKATCQLCGEPMSPGEEMFNFHGYSGPCPKPPLPRATDGLDPNVPHFRRGGNGGDVLLIVGGKEYRIPADHWCSDIAQVSYYDECDYGFYRAWEFHGKRPIHSTNPIRDKPVPSDF